MRSSIGVGVLGLGVVAGQVVRNLLDPDRSALLAAQMGCPLVLKRVKVIESDLTRPLARELGTGVVTTSDAEFFGDPDIDIVVEAIGGEMPAYEYLKKALAARKHVVTSNKEVIAKHGVEFWQMAASNKVGLHYEASVGGGIPIVSPFQRDLTANRIVSVHAIINGTTNFILTQMAQKGVDFQSALKTAQELGYAEANPRNDIDGIDAAYKIAIMASLAFHCEVKPEDIYHEGISRLSSRDFKYAAELGYAVKLLAITRIDDSGIEARVHPVFIVEDSLLAKVDGVFNAIQVEGDLVGKLLFYGRGAGPFPTSSAVVADIVAAAKDVLSGSLNVIAWRPDPAKKLIPMSALKTCYYLRMQVADRPGVLAQLTRVLGDNQISINSVIQKGVDAANQTAELVIMTHPAAEKAMQQALHEFETLPVVSEISNFVRVEEV